MPHPRPPSCSIIFLLDDCNDFLTGLPAYIRVTLQSTLSTAARVILLNVNQGILVLGSKPSVSFRVKSKGFAKTFKALQELTHHCSNLNPFCFVPQSLYCSRAGSLVPGTLKDTFAPRVCYLLSPFLKHN